MKILNPYINFSGRCREALTFYEQCLGGEITVLLTFADMPRQDGGKDVPTDAKDMVMHAELRAENIHLMATDGMPGQDAAHGNNITLNITFNELQEQDKVFNGLSHGGTVIQPLQDAFWGSRFGMLVDQFGIHWMLTCDNG